jgi:hypothetical protein
MLLFEKIENSFKASIKGEEDIKTLIRWWGFLGYFFFYFVANKIIKASDLIFIDVAVSSIATIYFSWHIFAMIKCSPKKPKLSKEEKRELRKKQLKEAPKAFMRKLLLKEPISRWNPITMTIAMDLLFFTHFFGFILK